MNDTLAINDVKTPEITRHARKGHNRPIVRLEMVESNPKFQLYRKRLEEIEFSGLSRKDKAKEIGVSRQCLLAWDNSGLLDWERINEKVRAGFLQQAPAVYSVLLRQALTGDTQAIRLWLERFENWSARQTLDITARRELEHVSEAELLAEAVRGVSGADKVKLLEIMGKGGECSQSNDKEQVVIEGVASTEGQPGNVGGYGTSPKTPLNGVSSC